MGSFVHTGLSASEASLHLRSSYAPNPYACLAIIPMLQDGLTAMNILGYVHMHMCNHMLRFHQWPEQNNVSIQSRLYVGNGRISSHGTGRWAQRHSSCLKPQLYKVGTIESQNGHLVYVRSQSTMFRVNIQLGEVFHLFISLEAIVGIFILYRFDFSLLLGVLFFNLSSNFL